MTSNHLLTPRKFTRYRSVHTWFWYCVIAVSIIVFTVVQLINAGQGPKIAFDPHIQTDGYTYSKNHQLNISGKHHKVSYLYINEELQTTNTDGTFSTNLYVWPGKSTIKVRAVDRYGRENIFTLKIYDPESTSAPNVASQADQLVRSVNVGSIGPARNHPNNPNFSIN